MKINEIIKEIIELENYCYFNVATDETFNETVKFFGTMPKDMQEFYKTFNGGLFFGFDFASIQDKKYEYSFKELNKNKFKKERYIPENVIIFADTNYGDFVGYDIINNLIIEVNPEANEDEWERYSTFTEFLDEFLKNSKKLIDEEVLEPLR